MLYGPLIESNDCLELHCDLAMNECSRISLFPNFPSDQCEECVKTFSVFVCPKEAQLLPTINWWLMLTHLPVASALLGIRELRLLILVAYNY